MNKHKSAWTPERRSKLSKTMLALWDDEKKARHSITMKRFWTPERRRKHWTKHDAKRLLNRPRNRENKTETFNMREQRIL
jgi:hypothetical protein